MIYRKSKAKQGNNLDKNNKIETSYTPTFPNLPPEIPNQLTLTARTNHVNSPRSKVDPSCSTIQTPAESGNVGRILPSIFKQDELLNKSLKNTEVEAKSSVRTALLLRGYDVTTRKVHSNILNEIDKEF